ncbi:MULTISPECIES: CHASE3 domain-containing protein [Acidobacteriaceae]|uniref:CHASE3 domain-containing protein n=1 Tax=Acidobacteriaceae TaxID=204434 RepID=UPI00131ABEDD|nr:MULTISPECIES: CHASE3 domain-containing protein [Acidobacteriaceae]MDW5266863.1 CHASE3 domain-containing protein [Edaphobacter sp.]
MQTFNKRFSVIAGFGLLVIILTANAIITRRQLGVQVENQVWVAHTRQVLFELAQTESILKDAETGQRGFLYTGDPKYLAPYNLAIGQVGPNIDKLANMTADNPRQQAHISALRNLAQAKVIELAQTITLYRSGRTEEAKALVLSDAGLFTMNNIRKLTSEMGEEETSLEAVRSAAYQKSIRVTTVCIYLASFIAALGLIFLAYYILREMELRQRHARQILEREEWFRVTLTSLGDAVIATDEQGQVTFLNPLAEQLTGRNLEYARGRPIQEVFPIFNESTHHIVENPVKKVMELGRIVGLANHTVLRNANGNLIPIEDSAAPIRDADHKLIGVVLVFRDATLERKSQEVLRKTEKLAAAARLAATVAHEINNPLEAIGNLLYITKGMAGLPAEAAEQLTLAEDEVARISHIARQTLGFYRESNVPDQVEIPALVDSVLNIYSNKFKTKNITLQREFGDCPPIRGLAGELKQAIANLISNAADAVSHNGTIRVKLECVETSNGQLVQVLIEDDGPGIGAEQRDRIFEPFFTTKKDVGTGLGLWVTKEIIDRHGGSIEVHSREDKHTSGAIFNVLLPSAPKLENPAQES